MRQKDDVMLRENRYRDINKVVLKCVGVCNLTENKPLDLKLSSRGFSPKILLFRSPVVITSLTFIKRA